MQTLDNFDIKTQDQLNARLRSILIKLQDCIDWDRRAEADSHVSRITTMLSIARKERPHWLHGLSPAEYLRSLV